MPAAVRDRMSRDDYACGAAAPGTLPPAPPAVASDA